MKRRLPAILISILTASSCADLTAPASRETSNAPEPRAPDPSQAAQMAKLAAQAARPPAEPPADPGGGEAVRASHILVSYQGASRANPDLTRTKEEAQKRAAELSARARKGEDFGKLAVENSDDPTASARSGDLGRFTRDRMVKPFADAAFQLKPGEISDVVETNFGYHVIKRTE